jgi:hypothetical protein
MSLSFFVSNIHTDSTEKGKMCSIHPDFLFVCCRVRAHGQEFLWQPMQLILIVTIHTSYLFVWKAWSYALATPPIGTVPLMKKIVTILYSTVRTVLDDNNLTIIHWQSLISIFLSLEYCISTTVVIYSSTYYTSLTLTHCDRAYMYFCSFDLLTFWPFDFTLTLLTVVSFSLPSVGRRLVLPWLGMGCRRSRLGTILSRD